MAAIGFVVHQHREGALALAQDTSAWLEQNGHIAKLLETGAATATAGSPTRSTWP